MYYHVEFGRSALKGEQPKIGERWNVTLLRWETRMTPRYTPLLHMCYDENLAVLRQRVGRNWEALGSRPIGMGRGLPRIKTHPSRVCVTSSNMVVLR